MADPADPKTPPQPTGRNPRAARRAELLRQNLRRRKAAVVRADKPDAGEEKSDGQA